MSLKRKIRHFEVNLWRLVHFVVLIVIFSPPKIDYLRKSGIGELRIRLLQSEAPSSVILQLNLFQRFIFDSIFMQQKKKFLDAGRLGSH
jgi:hypothetical protein